MTIVLREESLTAERLVVDPINLSIIWNKILSITEEMGSTLRRTAYSDAVREGDDFSTGLFDRDGRLIAQGHFAPGHSGSMLDLIRNINKFIPVATLQLGDSIVFNDSALGSGHLPDVYVITPIFHRSEMIGFTGVSAHHVDVGGIVAGSQQVSGVTEIYQEGLRILPVRLFRQNEVDEDIRRLILANVRMPDKVWGDLLAQRNASYVGCNRYIQLFEEYGAKLLDGVIEGILETSEMKMRDQIGKLPPGKYEFEDCLDDAGPGTEPVIFHVEVTIAGDEIEIDFSKSSDAVAAGINAYYNFTRAWANFGVMVLSGAHIPQNAGTVRPITVTAREGSYFNPRHPAPSAGRAAIQVRIFEVINGAFAKAVPDRAMAGFSHWSNPNISGIDPRNGQPFVQYDLIFGGYGGQLEKDGEEGLSPVMNCSNIPVEVYERNSPMLVHNFGFIPDSAGSGMHRGGCGVRKDVEILCDTALITLLSDRHKFKPYGLCGGEPGQLGSTTLFRGNECISMSSKETRTLRRGDIVSFKLAGAGGYGDPRNRQPSAIADDLSDGFISSGRRS